MIQSKERKFLFEYFNNAAGQWPENVAIDVPPGRNREARRLVRYQELKQQSDALADNLQQQIGIKHLAQGDAIIVILLPRSNELLYVAQLAVLKAGAAHACIDPVFPDEQIKSILADAKSVAILTDSAGALRLAAFEHDPPIIDVERWSTATRKETSQPIAPSWLSPESLAYLIYTSGTTGQPKGVMIEHRSITNLVQGDLDSLGIRPTDRVAQNSSSAYDSSIEETWFSLAAGATLVVMDDEATRLGPDLVAWLRAERVTMFCPPPTLLRSASCNAPHLELPDLRLIHVGGEALPQDVADRWAVGRTLINDYGPTETTVTALRGLIKAGEAVTIGTPVPGMKAWVLDRELNEVPTGIPGELCLGGIGLARGYRNQPELTNEKFPHHPQLGRIYRTGDLATRNQNGMFSCHGRIDSQVKIRGYRIELEAIEAHLSGCEGVREAVCAVQGQGSLTSLVAFVVPSAGIKALDVELLKSRLRRELPTYMIPRQVSVLAEIPRNSSGKLDRKALPVFAPSSFPIVTGQADSLEEKLTVALQLRLQLLQPPSIDDDFFDALGGTSLLAAEYISQLRTDPETAMLTVRDIYETLTIRKLAERARLSASMITTECGGSKNKVSQSHSDIRDSSRCLTARPGLTTMFQGLWLLLGVFLSAPIVYLGAFVFVPALLQLLGLPLFIALLPVGIFCLLFSYSVTSVLLAVLVKRFFIGAYVPCRAPVWSSFYLRHWIVQQTARLIPWQMLAGTEFQLWALRFLGARIGDRVHVHRGVHLWLGGWDLLDIGDDVTISQDAFLRLVELENGDVVVGPVRLENGSTLAVRAGAACDTHLGVGAYLDALSFLPRGSKVPAGERWSGVPAIFAGKSPPRAEVTKRATEISPILHGILHIGTHIVFGWVLLFPILITAFLLGKGLGLEHASTLTWLVTSPVDRKTAFADLFLFLSALPLTLLTQALTIRCLQRTDVSVISRWSFDYIVVWLKTGITQSANRWLSGSLLWPAWLRLAGMKVGRGSEIGLIIDTVPELVSVGNDSFFADGIYLAGPILHQGRVTLAQTELGFGVFLGNHAVVPIGAKIPDGVLVGVSTVANAVEIRPGTSWFGQPPFQLYNREIVEMDPSLTHFPSRTRYFNRWFWEVLRFAVPAVPIAALLIWAKWIAIAEESLSFPALVMVVVPVLELLYAMAMIGFVLLTKWVLLGRVRPGVHPLWSCWCSRWDFLYVVWDFLASAIFASLEGTKLLNSCLRLSGMSIGKNVVFGSGCGFSHVVDPDMITIEDGATVNCLFQAHTFEDRVLKIDRIRIGEKASVGYSAVLLYGAEIGDSANVSALSVVMKRERLLPMTAYIGCPVRLLEGDNYPESYVGDKQLGDRDERAA